MRAGIQTTRSRQRPKCVFVCVALLSIMACDTAYVLDDPDGAMRKESEPDIWWCGDEEISPLGGETCDGDNLNGETCESLGLPAGTLRCAPSCYEFDTSRCLGEGVCGDNVIQSGFEDCDGLTIVSTCSELGLGTGRLTCTESCELDTAGCEEEADVAEHEVADVASDAEHDVSDAEHEVADVASDAEHEVSDAEREVDAAPGDDTDEASDGDAEDDTQTLPENDMEIDARPVDGAGDSPRRSLRAGGCTAVASAPGLSWMLLGLLGLRGRRPDALPSNT
ncbi:MAG: hypothetical protein ACJA1R_000645 [Flavobacteriales bacterium]|jgi:hypothetical protein